MKFINSKNSSEKSWSKKSCLAKIKYGKEYLIFYDIETNSGVGEIMEPFLISSDWSVNREEDECLEFRTKDYIYDGMNDPTKEFIEDVFRLGRVVAEKSPRAKIRVIAYNGGRFDHIVLLKKIVSECHEDLKIFGTPNSIKILYCGNISFEDGLVMTGGGRLDDFVKAMGLTGKLECEELFTIKKRDDWLNMNENV